MVEVTIGAHTRHRCVEVRPLVAVSLALCPFCHPFRQFLKKVRQLSSPERKNIAGEWCCTCADVFHWFAFVHSVQLHTGDFRSLGNHNTYCCSNHCRSDRKSCFDTPQRCPFIASFLKVKLCCDVSVCNQHVFSPTNSL